MVQQAKDLTLCKRFVSLRYSFTLRVSGMYLHVPKASLCISASSLNSPRKVKKCNIIDQFLSSSNASWRFEKKVHLQTTSCGDVIAKYGTPWYMKVDVEDSHSGKRCLQVVANNTVGGLAFCRCSCDMLWHYSYLVLHVSILDTRWCRRIGEKTWKTWIQVSSLMNLAAILGGAW